MIEISQISADKFPFKGSLATAPINELSQELLDMLNADELQEFGAFTNLKRQQEYLTSRLVIKQMINKWVVDPANFKILKDELGRPYGQDKTDQYFVSIAHTRQKVFCGISPNSQIGVDLEPVDRRVPEHLKQRILHPDESDSVSLLKSIRLWTIKEAFIKLAGQGLRLNMSEVHVKKYGHEEFIVEIDNEKRAKICSFQSENNWLAVAFYQ